MYTESVKTNLHPSVPSISVGGVTFLPTAPYREFRKVKDSTLSPKFCGMTIATKDARLYGIKDNAVYAFPNFITTVEEAQEYLEQMSFEWREGCAFASANAKKNRLMTF